MPTVTNSTDQRPLSAGLNSLNFCGLVSELELNQPDMFKATLSWKIEHVCLYLCLPTNPPPYLPPRVSRSWSEAQSAPAGAEDGPK